MNATAFLQEAQEWVNAALDRSLPDPKSEPRRLHEAMRYAVFAGGKRLRPAIALAACRAAGGTADEAVSSACALEMLHTYSLIHDDLPAIDDDDLRRGQPTLHRQYDEATAILAADALQPLAFDVLAGASGIAPATRVKLVKLLADACGSIGMTGGQSLDLAAEGQSLDAAQIEHMYSLKTGALIHASVVSASELSADLSPERISALDAFGRTIGIAFQIKDDILDVEGDTDVIGKPSGSDQRLDKATYPGLVGIRNARQRCDELLNGALEHLDDFGTDAEPLSWLARFIVERGS